jgi:hypothetical protein
VRRSLLFLIALAAVLVVPVAQAGPGLVVGINDDSPKWKDDPVLAAAAADLGIGAYRLTMTWDGSQTSLAAGDRSTLDRAVLNVHGRRVLLSVFGRPDAAPHTDAARAAYCSYVGSILTTYPSIRTVGIWNEVNKASFWRPQYNGSTSVAPAEYVKLLAACSSLRTTFPDVVLVSSLSPRGNDNPNAASNVSHSPVKFIAGMGAAVRGLALQGRIFDHFGQNVYGASSSERPFRAHPNNTDIAQGDYAKLMAALTSAFGGTSQPVPGTKGVTVWYLETGFQTAIPNEKRSLYTGVENDAHPLAAARPGPDPGSSDPGSPGWDQATQLGNAIRLAFCQPAVGAFFNFELADEPSLAGWQSGVLWVDGTPKPSYAAVKAAIAQVAAGSVDCAAINRLVKAGPTLLTKPKKLH